MKSSVNFPNYFILKLSITLTRTIRKPNFIYRSLCVYYCLQFYQIQKYMKKIWCILKIVLIFIILHSVDCDRYDFFRNVECTNITNTRCVNWTQNIFISKTIYTAFQCFSEKTYVQTKNGPQTMDKLKAGDQILGIDPNTGTIGYSCLQLWLHRDRFAETEYQALHIANGTSFQASSFHNLAYFDQKGKVNYKFTHSFKAGDNLVGFPHQALTVTSKQQGLKRVGLYSPYTKFNNFFVYQAEFKNQTKKGKMILAHVLSQIENPNSKVFLTEIMIWSSNLFGANYQPSQNEIYVHPLIQIFSFLYGDTWKAVKNKVTYSHESLKTIMSSHQNDDGREQQKLRQMYSIISIISVLYSPTNL